MASYETFLCRVRIVTFKAYALAVDALLVAFDWFLWCSRRTAITVRLTFSARQTRTVRETEVAGRTAGPHAIDLVRRGALLVVAE